MTYSGSDVVLVVHSQYKESNETYPAYVLPLQTAQVSAGINAPLMLSVQLQYIPGAVALVPGMHVALLQGDRNLPIAAWESYSVLADGVITSITTETEDIATYGRQTPFIQLTLEDPIYKALTTPIHFFDSNLPATAAMEKIIKLISSGHKVMKPIVDASNPQITSLEIGATKALAGYLQNIIYFIIYLTKILVKENSDAGTTSTQLVTMQWLIDAVMAIGTELHWDLTRSNIMYKLRQQIICPVPGSITDSWRTLLKQNSTALTQQLHTQLSQRQQVTLLELVSNVLGFYTPYLVSQPLPFVVNNAGEPISGNDTIQFTPLPTYFTSGTEIKKNIAQQVATAINNTETTAQTKNNKEDQTIRVQTYITDTQSKDFTVVAAKDAKPIEYIGKYMILPSGSLKPLLQTNDIPKKEVLKYNIDVLYVPPTRYLITSPLTTAGATMGGSYVVPYLDTNTSQVQYKQYNIPLSESGENNSNEDTVKVVWNIENNTNLTYTELIETAQELSPVEWGVGIQLGLHTFDTRQFGMYYGMFLSTLQNNNMDDTSDKLNEAVRQYKSDKKLLNLNSTTDAYGNPIELNKDIENIKKIISSSGMDIVTKMLAQWWFKSTMEDQRYTKPGTSTVQLHYHPEIRVGFPIRIQYSDTIYLLGTVTHITHNINPENISTTTVQLNPELHYIVANSKEELYDKTLQYLTKVRSLWDLYILISTQSVSISSNVDYNLLTTDVDTFREKWVDLTIIENEGNGTTSIIANPNVSKTLKNKLEAYLLQYAYNLQAPSAVPAMPIGIPYRYAAIHNISTIFTTEDAKKQGGNSLLTWLYLNRARLDGITISNTVHHKTFISSNPLGTPLWGTIEDTYTYLLSGGRTPFDIQQVNKKGE